MIRLNLRIPHAELQKLARDVDAWSGRKHKEVQKVVVKTAYAIEATAKRSIQSGPKSGRVYKRGKKTHQASAPGEAPATDTGDLVNRIRTDLSKIADLVAAVGTDLDKGLYTELGTSSMLARPWLRPAFEAHKDEFLRELKRIYSTK